MRSEDTRVMVDAIIRQTEMLAEQRVIMRDEARAHQMTIAASQQMTGQIHQRDEEINRLTAQVDLWCGKAATLAEQLVARDAEIKRNAEALAKSEKLWLAAKELEVAMAAGVPPSQIYEKRNNLRAAVSESASHFDPIPF